MIAFRLVRVVAAVFALVLVVACATVPVTGRKQLSLVSDSELLSMSLQQYGEFLKENKPVAGGPQLDLVRKVGLNTQQAVERYMQSQGLGAKLANYKWEFNLVESKEANAWCMPGGKVVVYTGLLPITKDETGLAVVVGHEIAHAIAGHGGERMSQGLLAQLGGAALDVALANKPAETKSLYMSAYGVGAQYGALMPFSRLQESEADHLGLVFMAMAGYDPSQALVFWERMAEVKSGAAPPEFLSTHPSDATRIQKIKERLPEAQAYYDKKQ